jgi:succinate-acetate transporter protein
MAADSTPLGLSGYGLSIFVLGCALAGFLPATGAVIPWAFFFGGLTLFLAGMWAFRNRNTFGATVFTSYGALWVGLAFFYLFGTQLGVTGASAQAALGVSLFVWAIFTLYMTVGALRTTVPVFGLLLTLLVALVLVDLGVLTTSMIWAKIGGYVAMLSGAIAWYAAAAGVINDTFGRQVLPVMPLR